MVLCRWGKRKFGLLMELVLVRLSMTFTANGKLHHVTDFNRDFSFAAYLFTQKDKYFHVRFIH